MARKALVCALLFGSVWAVYWPARHYGFLELDDAQYVRYNPHIEKGLTLQGLRWAFKAGVWSKCRHADYWLPATVVSRMADYSLYGPDAGGHHRTNILLHALDAVLVFLVLAELTGGAWAAAWAAAFFALHPLRVESVAWITERKDVLCGFFWLSSLWAYLGWVRRPSPWRYAGLVALFASALAAKPMAMTLPVVLLLLDFWPLRRRALAEKAPLFLMSGACLALALAAQGFHLGFHSRSVQAGWVLVSTARYLRDMVWPVGLSAYYPHPGAGPGLAALVLSAAVLLGASWAAWRQREQRPYLLTGWLWYLAVLLPVAGLPTAVRSDRFTYLPLIGVALMAACLAQEAAGRGASWRKAVALLGLLTLAPLPWLTRAQLAYWRDGVTLMRRAADLAPWAPEAHRFLGHALAQAGRPADAVSEYEEALRRMADLEKSRPLASAAREAAAAGDLGGASLLFEQALRRNHEAAREELRLAQALEAAGRPADSQRPYVEVLRMSNEAAALETEYAAFLTEKGRSSRAERHRRRADLLSGAEESPEGRPSWEVSPGVEHFRQAAAMALADAAAAKKDYKLAAELYSQAARLSPLADARNKLAFALLKLRMEDEAASQFEAALRLDPELGGAHAFLGDILLRRGRREEALAHLREAARLWPDSGWVRGRLAEASRAPSGK